MTARNGLTGPIPSEIGFLTKIQYLNLCKWAFFFINSVKNVSHPVRLSHAFLVLLDSSRMTDNNELTDPMPKAEIESMGSNFSCDLSKLLVEMFVVS
jgi:hypothetical protein